MLPKRYRSIGTRRSALHQGRTFSLTILGVIAAAVLCGILSASLSLWLGPSPAAAIPIDITSVRLYGVAKTQVDDLRAQANAVQSQIDSLDADLEKHTESYNQLTLRLDEINVRMSSLRQELKQAEAEHAYRVHMLENRICELYKSGGRDQLLQLLLLSEGLEDLFTRIRLVATLADQDHRLIVNLQESNDRLNAVLQSIDEQKQEELSVRRLIDEKREQIQAELEERQQTLAGLDSRIRTLVEQERQRQIQEQEKLRQALAGLLNGGQIYSGPLPQTDSAVLNQFVETSAAYMGIPYVWAGDRPSTGFDCSGFTRYVYAQHGVDLPHYSGYQAQMGTPVALADIQAGDLVAFGFPVHHVGIYIGDGLFIHAPRTGDVVKISHLSDRTNLAAIRRFSLQPRNEAPTVR